MTYYIIIRGPLGIGKSTISKKLAQDLKAEYFAVDKVIDENPEIKTKEDGYISQETFRKVNEIVAKKAKPLLDQGKSIIFDGNFYWQSAIKDLEERLNYKHFVFTLKAPLEVCIDRDANRENTHGKDAAEVVYKKTTSFDYGEVIDTNNKSIDDVLKETKRKIK